MLKLLRTQSLPLEADDPAPCAGNVCVCSVCWHVRVSYTRVVPSGWPSQATKGLGFVKTQRKMENEQRWVEGTVLGWFCIPILNSQVEGFGFWKGNELQKL